MQYTVFLLCPNCGWQHGRLLCSRQIRDARKALDLLPILGYPAKQDYRKIIKGGLIKNCDVKLEDVDRMYDIWKDNVASLKGKTTRGRPDRARNDIVALPAEILEKNKFVSLDMDIYCNGRLAFNISLSRNILLTTIQHLKNREKADKLQAVKMISQVYVRR